MKPSFKLLSMLLALALILTCLPAGVFAAAPRFDAVSGATGGGDDDDDDDTPSNFGNSPADASQYELAPFSPGSMSGTSLSALMDESPIFYCGSGEPVQLMYYCIRGYAYMFYLYGDSYSNYVGISYGYGDAIEVKDENVWNSLMIGTPKAAEEIVYRGEASVSDSEGSFLSLDVYASAERISDLIVNEAGCVGSWENLVSMRKAEYVGKPIDEASAYDGVSSATKYSAALKEAVFNALGLSSEADPTAAPTAEPTAAPTQEPDSSSPAHEKYITAANAKNEYVLHLNVTAKDGTETVIVPGEPTASGSNIVLAIDVSGSITGTALDELNSAIRRLVSELPDGSQLGIVAFADGVTEGEVCSSPDQVPTITETDGGSNLAPALVNAKALLDNVSAWDEPDNSKVIVVISDGEMTDPEAAILEANGPTIKGSGVHIYSISVRTDTVYVPGEVFWIAGSYGSGEDYSMAMLQAVSDNYLSAYTDDYSFIYKTVVLGDRNADGRDYVFGTNGADWSSIFTTITENEIVEQRPVPMSGVVIEDVLSEYVELAHPESANYGVTADGVQGFTVSLSGSAVTVSLEGELAEGVTYTVNIPVRPSQAAILAANSASGRSVELPTNSGATLSFNWGDERITLDYAQTPVIRVEKQSFTLTIHYVYGSGEQAFADHVETVYCGEAYSVESPYLEAYQPDPETVSGVMGTGDIEITVVYSCTVLLGDANCDGIVDFSDAAAIAAYIMTGTGLSVQGLLNAEVSGDGAISPADITALYNLLFASGN